MYDPWQVCRSYGLYEHCGQELDGLRLLSVSRFSRQEERLETMHYTYMSLFLITVTSESNSFYFISTFPILPKFASLLKPITQEKGIWKR